MENKFFARIITATVNRRINTGRRDLCGCGANITPDFVALQDAIFGPDGLYFCKACTIEIAHQERLVELAN